jgi:hypothetical protein
MVCQRATESKQKINNAHGFNKRGFPPLPPAVYEWFVNVMPGGSMFASYATQFMATVVVSFPICLDT